MRPPGPPTSTWWTWRGAKTGQTTNLPTIERIAAQTGLFVRWGAGIRSMDTVRRYLEAGASRVILGTAAVTDPDFTAQAVAQYGDKIAVGADLKDGKVAIKGWLETSQNTWETFFGPDAGPGGAHHDLHRHLPGRGHGGDQPGPLPHPGPAVFYGTSSPREACPPWRTSGP